MFQELVENESKFISYYQAISFFGWGFGGIIFGLIIDIYSIEFIFQGVLYLSLINLVLIPLIKENRASILERHEKNVVENDESSFSTNSNQKSSILHSIYYSLFVRSFGVKPILAVLAIIFAFYLNKEMEIDFLIGFNPVL